VYLLLQILKDDASLKDSSVTESGFCVVMIMKVGAVQCCSVLCRGRPFRFIALWVLRRHCSALGFCCMPCRCNAWLTV
jgi:hypothetical protein